MALTQEEKDTLIQEVINAITTQSTSIDSLDTAKSIEDTESLPAYKKNSSELVRVPLSLLYDPVAEATDRANTATNSANIATLEAEVATTRANDVADYVTELGTTLEGELAKIENIKSTAEEANTTAKQLESQLTNLSLKVLTEAEYEALENKEENTLYFCTEE